jgi:hypothetical protein
MEPLNFCRQILAQFKAMALVPSIEPEKKAVVDHIIDLCRASQKFMLPQNGALLPDDELRALDESKPLRLPHPFVALEYTLQATSTQGNQVTLKKVLFCREDDDGIYVRPAGHLSSNGFWIVKRDAFIPKTDYLDRSDPRQVKIIAEYQQAEGAKDGFRHVHVVLGFLNALACSNVRTQAIMPKKAGKKIKSALPFDTYHFLTIDVGKSSAVGTGLAGRNHRSPREHLRRGHIRRLEDGRRIWVNATVVAACMGSGKVSRDYLVTNSKAGAISAKVAA